MKNINQLKIVFFALVYLIGCNEDPDLLFDPSLVPGTYIGEIQYHSFSTHPANNLDTIPGEAVLNESCNYIITQKGENVFNLSIDQITIPPKPDLDFEIVQNTEDNVVGLHYLENDANLSRFSLGGGGPTARGYIPPANHMIYYKFQNRIVFALTVRKNHPDSVHFITFYGENIL
jgi:hypothetical protein